MNKLIILSLAVVSMLTVSCGNDDGDNPRHRVELSADEHAMMNTQNRFGYDLFSQLPVDDVTLLSPYSVVQCMSLITNGAAGNTLTELEKALVAPGVSIESFNSLNKRLNNKLPALDKKVDLSIANAMWFNNNIAVKPEFRQICTDYYMADVKNTDLFSSASCNEINNWAAEKTRGKIDRLLSHAPNASQFIANAIYFNGKWQERFKEKNTKEADFTNRNGLTSKVMMMARYNESITYDETDKLQIATLEYGNGAYQMVIALPKKDLDMLDDIDPAMWNEIRSRGNAAKSRITLKLPRFELCHDMWLTDYLKQTGINGVFEPDADFSAISDQKISMNAIRQQIYFKVDENGTEAAAVTSTSGDTLDGPGRYDGTEMIVDHPFAFIIEETSTGAVLFMGRINRL